MGGLIRNAIKKNGTTRKPIADKAGGSGLNSYCIWVGGRLGSSCIIYQSGAAASSPNPSLHQFSYSYFVTSSYAENSIRWISLWIYHRSSLSPVGRSMQEALHGLDGILCIRSISPSYRMAPRCMGNALDSPSIYISSDSCACFSKAMIKPFSPP